MAVEPLSKQLQRILPKIQKAVNETLADDVFPTVKNEMGLAIQREVYDEYNPDVYKRRGKSGGLADPRNIVGGVLNGRLIVVNKTPPNTDTSAYSTNAAKMRQIAANASNKNLSALVEYGHGSKGLYDFVSNRDYMKSRPFIEATKNAISSKWLEVFKRGMARRGFKLSPSSASSKGINQYQQRMSKSMLEKYMRSRNFSTYAKTMIRDMYINKGLSLAEAEATTSRLANRYSSRYIKGSKTSMYRKRR